MGCKDKNGIGCSVEPPSLSHSVVRNLGEALCKIDPTNLTFVALRKKKLVASPGGKKPLKKKNTNSTDDSAAPSRRSPRSSSGLVLKLSILLAWSDHGLFLFTVLVVIIRTIIYYLYMVLFILVPFCGIRNVYLMPWLSEPFINITRYDIII